VGPLLQAILGRQPPRRLEMGRVAGDDAAVARRLRFRRLLLQHRPAAAADDRRQIREVPGTMGDGPRQSRGVALQARSQLGGGGLERRGGDGGHGGRGGGGGGGGTIEAYL
jgi:hypothetical protein